MKQYAHKIDISFYSKTHQEFDLQLKHTNIDFQFEYTEVIGISFEYIVHYIHLSNYLEL